MKIFGREPAVYVAFLQAVLIALVGFGALDFVGLDGPDDVMLVTAVVAAVGALVLAYKTSRTLLAPVIEVFKAGLALAALYGLDMSAENAAAIVAVLTLGVGLFQQSQVSPLEKGTYQTV